MKFSNNKKHNKTHLYIGWVWHVDIIQLKSWFENEALLEHN